MSTMKEMWNTRPARLPRNLDRNAMIAGVCEGIGFRYQIDPVLVRIAFVAGGFLGGGVLAYLIAWAIMPRYGVEYSPIEAVLRSKHSVLDTKTFSSEQNTGWGLIVAFILLGGLGLFTWDVLTSSTALTFGGFVLGWWALHNHMPNSPETEEPAITWDPLNPPT